MDNKNTRARYQWDRSRTKATSKVDLSYLEDMSGGDTEFMIEVIDMFRDAAPAGLQQAMVDLRNGNFPQLRAAVHKLKPSVQMLGHTELYELAATIEEQCATIGQGVSASDSELHANVVKFCKEANLLLRELEQVVAELRAK